MSAIKLMKAEDVADLLGVSKAQIRNWVWRGVFPTGVVVRIGRRTYFHEDRLSEWLASGGQLSGKSEE